LPGRPADEGAVQDEGAGGDEREGQAGDAETATTGLLGVVGEGREQGVHARVAVLGADLEAAHEHGPQPRGDAGVGRRGTEHPPQTAAWRLAKVLPSNGASPWRAP